MDIKFEGEHLLPGSLGQFFIILSFGSALLAAISYYFATIKDLPDNSWRNLGRLATWVNSLAVIGIGSCLFYIIYNHLFEYHYAWAHSSRSLPTHYIISSFWEGQEGSFWLWMFWQSFLANILVWRAKSWENSVLAIVMLSQVFLASMLLGVEILGTRIGSSPFILLREAVEAPIFSRPDYLSLVADGNGLNPLLQNYWMVIHPPTLFLGFASMIVPFAYAIGGLWEKRFKDWTTVALPWALFAVMVLGAGIIMGSFWAYEALNFGGFWAWDPVENASIIPWLTLIAAVHVILAYRHSGHSYFTATFLTLISFVLVLYASFLTRSGILGETSVHSFTDLGMFGHLIVYIAVFVLLTVGFIVARWKEMPITKKDEETYSREFWLFVGAVVLALSCGQILYTTSGPVINAILGTKIAPPVDVIAHYNKWQVPFAVVITFISGFTQFLKYKNTDPKKFFSSMLTTIVIAVVFTGAFVYLAKIHSNLMYIVLTFAGFFSLICNGKILLEAFKGKWKLAGSSVAHMGFALLVIGALVAAATNNVISINNSGAGYGEEFAKENNPKENIMLYENEPVSMDKYTVTYLGDSIAGPNTFYKVNYKVVNNGKIKENFTLYPNAQQNAKMRSIVASPDTRHYLLNDIYTHVSSVPLQEKTGGHEHELEESSHSDESYDTPAITMVSPGDTVRYRNGFIIVKGVNRNANIEKIKLAPGDLAIGLDLEVHNNNGKVYNAQPLYLIKGGNVFDFGKAIDEEGLKLRFSKIDPQQGKLELTVLEKKPAEKKWIVMKAIKFPYINLYWGGTIIMVIGFLLSIFRRNKEVKTA
ncbi:heme lyase CcmF/NrfE family subunit [Desertivirga brevis]|uniref:heme lyase CcmF/NrfE family subunit n=1 Tax=Desertivirga brevis TaxID=2810310 RepID=UPI001A96A835|nr:cytochrome c biogenesis protein CcsA [Pedobacter sp. SYSU D00873]